MPSAPVIDGFDLDVRDGGWWKFAVTSEWDGEVEAGSFVLSLGASTMVGGEPAFPTQITQLSGALSIEFRWVYLSFVGNRIRGSADGATFEPLFDANTGRWPATSEGLFTNLRDKGIVEAEPDGENWRVVADIIDSTGCEYIEGYGTICTEDPEYYQGWDVFRPNVGPWGSHFYGCSDGCLTQEYKVIDSSITGSRPVPTE